MDEKKIIIQIHEDGHIFAETDGMIGTECVDELDKLMKDIVLSTNRTKKAEFFKEKTSLSNDIKVTL